ncbi:MAG TPA: hypothetical protein VFD72_03640 [Sphingobacteriaceae bacterium]|nr:hypothetical protein [Sphingobacteriaceae bacterium]
MRNKVIVVLWLIFCVGFGQQAGAQTRSIYTVLQAGGIIGLQSDLEKAVSGYQLQFIVGQNYNDRTFVGFGIANEVYRGGTVEEAGIKRSHRMNTLPLTIDFRQAVAQVTAFGQLGLVGGLGYAMPLGGEYYHGLSAKAGLTYAQMLIDRSHLKFTLAYGYQQFDSNIIRDSFGQHQLHLTVGLFSF